MTIKIPVVFEEGVFKPLVDVPFKSHQRITFKINMKDADGFTHEEWKKIEKLFDEKTIKAFNSSKASFDFHKKLCNL